MRIYQLTSGLDHDLCSVQATCDVQKLIVFLTFLSVSPTLHCLIGDPPGNVVFCLSQQLWEVWHARSQVKAIRWQGATAVCWIRDPLVSVILLKSPFQVNVMVLAKLNFQDDLDKYIN